MRTPRPARLRHALPTLALGLTALAVALPTSVTVEAAPTVPTVPAESDSRSRVSPVVTPSSGRHLTAAARRAGVELGNAPMGWRQHGTQRPLALARSSDDDFTPKGVLGVDVSSYQRKITWSTWTKQDRDFAFVKATEGTSYKNPYFKNQYKGAAKAGMIRGAYHFASPSGKAGYKQARFFVKNGGGWSADGRTLPGVLDIEYNPYGKTCYGLSKKKMVKWIHSFTAEYWRLTGRHAVIYTTTDWWKRCTGNDTSFKKNPLWVARYGTKKPGALPKSWTVATFWQYTSDPIDQNVFPAKMKKLKALAKKD